MREGILSSLPASEPILGDRDSAHWGLASLLMGGFLMLGALVTLVFNIVFWSVGPRGIPMHFASLGCLIGLAAIAGLNITSLVFGVRGWQQSLSWQRTPALAIAGTLTSSVALVAWIAVGVDLVAILQTFTP